MLQRVAGDHQIEAAVVEGHGRAIALDIAGQIARRQIQHRQLLVAQKLLRGQARRAVGILVVAADIQDRQPLAAQRLPRRVDRLAHHAVAAVLVEGQAQEGFVGHNGGGRIHCIFHGCYLTAAPGAQQPLVQSAARASVRDTAGSVK